MNAWVIEKLRKNHDRGAFSCGTAALDTFLRDVAGQYETKHIGRTLVATAQGDCRVCGYYTAATSSFSALALPKETRKRLPAIRFLQSISADWRLTAPIKVKDLRSYC